MSTPRAVAIAFALGTAVCSVSLGILPVIFEIEGAPSWQAADMAVLAVVTLVVASVQGFAWGAGVYAAIGVRRWIALSLLGAAAIGSGVLKLAAIGFVAQETRRPSLIPMWGTWLAAGCDLLLILSFAGVLGRSDRASRGDAPHEDPASAAWVWLVMTSMLGTAIAPYLGLRLLAAAVFAFALIKWLRATPAGPRWRAWLEVPVVAMLVVGIAVAVVRTSEHRRLSAPGLLGVYALPSAQHCFVRPANDCAVEGGSLWSIECSPGQQALIGWDEARGHAIEGEDLASRRRPLP